MFICVGDALERALLTYDMRCLRIRADAHSTQEIRMLGVGDAFERALLRVLYEPMFHSPLIG